MRRVLYKKCGEEECWREFFIRFHELACGGLGYLEMVKYELLQELREGLMAICGDMMGQKGKEERILWIRRVSVLFAFICTPFIQLLIYIYTQYTMYNIYSCFASLLSPHAMFPPCRFCFETNYVKKKGDSSKPSFTIYNFFQFFPCLTTIPFFKLVQSCVKIIWKTFACCTWWIADDRRGSQVRLVSSARLRVCLHWMWP